uniref:Uncharacterized protein n=1 Tax=Oryza glumipatula TaxID=40148 RepID=A0A0E0A7G8_9ORYZ
MAKPSGWPNCSTGWPNVASLLHWLKPRADNSDGGVNGAEGHGGLVPVAGDLGHALRAHGVLDPPGIGGLLGVARVVLGEQVVVEGDEDAGEHVSGARLWWRGWDEIEEVGRVDMGVLEAHEEGDELGELVAEEGRGGRGGRGGGATTAGSRRGRGRSRRAPRRARPGGVGIRGEQDGLLEVIHGGGGGGGGIWAGAEGGKEERGRGGRVGGPPLPRGTASPPCSHPCSCSCSGKGGENLEEQRVEADTRVPLPYTQNREDKWRGCWSK